MLSYVLERDSYVEITLIFINFCDAFFYQNSCHKLLETFNKP